MAWCALSENLNVDMSEKYCVQQISLSSIYGTDRGELTEMIMSQQVQDFLHKSIMHAAMSRTSGRFTHRSLCHFLRTASTSKPSQHNVHSSIINCCTSPPW
jgi:hypothetical protein